METTFFDDVYEGSNEVRPRGVTLITLEESHDMEIDIIDHERPALKRVILLDGKIIYKL